MAAPILKGGAQLRRYAAGVVFLVVIAMLVGLSLAMYTKKFAAVTLVDLEADRVGNQLSVHADVKVRGLRIGEVREVSSNGQGATIRLAIDKDKARLVPNNVSARLLPKTLFGEKEVDLVLPAGARGRSIRAGDVISTDRSETAIETERVLNDFLPLLQSLEPVQLSTTLNALSGALRGRGDRIGNNLALNAAYFRQLNPLLPKMLEDFRGLADVTNSYADATPDILRMLDNFSFSSRSLVDQRGELSAFLQSTSAFSRSATDFLTINERNLIGLAAASRPNLEVYARYSPEYACILHTLPKQEILGEKTFGGMQPGLHITLELIRDQGPYVNGDQPKFGEDRGPTCFGLGDKPVVPFPAYYEPKDGYCDAEEAQSPGVTTDNCHDGSGTGNTPTAATDPARALGGRTQTTMVARAVAPVLQLEPGQVPDIATLLFGPIARGGTVSYLLG
ncbi:MAG: MCE family protein [Actinobacteria bacterium]|nr:MCE family protein [Actinomycetota bacterium]